MPYRFKFFHFHAVFGGKWDKIIGWRPPPLWLALLTLGNPRTAIGQDASHSVDEPHVQQSHEASY